MEVEGSTSKTEGMLDEWRERVSVGDERLGFSNSVRNGTKAFRRGGMPSILVTRLPEVSPNRGRLTAAPCAEAAAPVPFTRGSFRPAYATSPIRWRLQYEERSLLSLHPLRRSARSPQPAQAPCRSRLPRHRHPMSTRLPGCAIRGDGAGGARTVIALMGIGTDMTAAGLATIPMGAGATTIIPITGAVMVAGTAAGTITTSSNAPRDEPNTRQ